MDALTKPKRKPGVTTSPKPPRPYPDLHDHVRALDKAGLLITVTRPINKQVARMERSGMRVMAAARPAPDVALLHPGYACFVDFYLDGLHRSDDAFALMEQHNIKQKKIELSRNIDHFAFLRRHIERPEREEFHFPIRGPRFFLPVPKPLSP